MNQYDFPDEQLRTQLIEAILEYLEGNRSLQSVVDLGLTINNRKFSNYSKLTEIVSPFNAMTCENGEGKSFSKERIREIFTTMLEKLTSD